MRHEIWSAYICSVQPSPVTNEACKSRDAVNDKKAITPNARFGVLIPLFLLLAHADFPESLISVIDSHPPSTTPVAFSVGSVPPFRHRPYILKRPTSILPFRWRRNPPFEAVVRKDGWYRRYRSLNQDPLGFYRYDDLLRTSRFSFLVYSSCLLSLLPLNVKPKIEPLRWTEKHDLKSNLWGIHSLQFLL
jgi:hypothetical protein